MKLAPQHGKKNSALETMEAIARFSGWPTEWLLENEVVVECKGAWSRYRLFALWEEMSQALHCTTVIDSNVPDEKKDEILIMLAAINTKLWGGHFEFNRENKRLCFRYTLGLRGCEGASMEQLEDIMEMVIGECDRFYPAFQYFLWGGCSVEESLEKVITEVKGQA